MKIDIYSKYEVTFKNSGAFISQENSTPSDIQFENYEHINKKIVDGGKLLEHIKYLINNDYLQEISIVNDTIKIETFNYNTGEGDTHIMIIKLYYDKMEDDKNV